MGGPRAGGLVSACGACGGRGAGGTDTRRDSRFPLVATEEKYRDACSQFLQAKPGTSGSNTLPESETVLGMQCKLFDLFHAVAKLGGVEYVRGIKGMRVRIAEFLAGASGAANRMLGFRESPGRKESLSIWQKNDLDGLEAFLRTKVGSREEQETSLQAFEARYPAPPKPSMKFIVPKLKPVAPSEPQPQPQPSFPPLPREPQPQPPALLPPKKRKSAEPPGPSAEPKGAGSQAPSAPERRNGDHREAGRDRRKRLKPQKAVVCDRPGQREADRLPQSREEDVLAPVIDLTIHGHRSGRQPAGGPAEAPVAKEAAPRPVARAAAPGAVGAGGPAGAPVAEVKREVINLVGAGGPAGAPVAKEKREVIILDSDSD